LTKAAVKGGRDACLVAQELGLHLS